MTIEGEFIPGFMVGFELFNDPIFGQGVMIDLFIYRVVITYE